MDEDQKLVAEAESELKVALALHMVNDLSIGGLVNFLTASHVRHHVQTLLDLKPHHD